MNKINDSEHLQHHYQTSFTLSSTHNSALGMVWIPEEYFKVIIISVNVQTQCVVPQRIFHLMAELWPKDIEGNKKQQQTPCWGHSSPCCHLQGWQTCPNHLPFLDSLLYFRSHRYSLGTHRPLWPRKKVWLLPLSLSLFFLIIFYYYPLDAWLFSNERKKGAKLDWRRGEKEPGGVDELKTITRIFYVRENIYFQLSERRKRS